MARFPHIPREAVLKEDLLRTGFAFDESALTDNLEGEVKPKSYFIFSFDQKPLAALGEAAKRRPTTHAMVNDLDETDRRLMAIDHHINSQNDELAREIEALRREEK